MTYIQELRKRAGDLPGGLMELGESAEETLVRELKEELDLNADLAEVHLRGVFAGEAFYRKLKYGTETYYTAVVYEVPLPAGLIVPDQDEVRAFGFFDVNSLPEGIAAIDREIIHQLK